MINSVKPLLPSFEEYINKISSIWDTHILTNNGDLLKEFKQVLIEHTKLENVSLFVNGHSALDIAIKALKLKGEVITTPFTFASTVHAITQNNLTPVFCDIEKSSFTIDASKIENLINEKTSAIIAVHIFGNPCNVYEIERIAKKYNIKVIYDAAQAFGVTVNGQNIGAFGDVSMFSLHAIKVYNSIEGGLLTYNDNRLTTIFELYKNFGIDYVDNDTIIESWGCNAKMNEFQAAMGILNLKYIDSEISKRKKIAEKYVEAFSAIPGLTTMCYEKNCEYNYAYFPVLVDKNIFGLDRDELFLKLIEQGIGVRKLYSTLCNDYACYKGKTYKADVPVAKEVSNSILDVPLYGSLTNENVQSICFAFEKISKGLK